MILQPLPDHCVRTRPWRGSIRRPMERRRRGRPDPGRTAVRRRAASMSTHHRVDGCGRIQPHDRRVVVLRRRVRLVADHRRRRPTARCPTRLAVTRARRSRRVRPRDRDRRRVDQLGMANARHGSRHLGARPAPHDGVRAGDRPRRPGRLAGTRQRGGPRDDPQPDSGIPLEDRPVPPLPRGPRDRSTRRRTDAHRDPRRTSRRRTTHAGVRRRHLRQARTGRLDADRRAPGGMV